VDKALAMLDGYYTVKPPALVARRGNLVDPPDLRYEPDRSPLKRR